MSMYNGSSSRLKPNSHPRPKQKGRLTYELIPDDIKKIADVAVGEGSLEAAWRSRDKGDTPFSLMWKIVDGTSVGFALYHFEEMTNGSFKYRVGVIDMVCVLPEYRNRSYGAVITYHVLKAMSAIGVNRIELIMREPAMRSYDDYPSMPIIGSERFLYDLGFKKVAYLPDFWKQQSQRYTYACNLCEHQPDKCTGILMAMNEG